MAVYFIKTIGADCVKIGWTDGDIYKRMDTLQTGCPYDLEVYFIAYDAERADEGKLHKRFAEYRMNGEWFTLSEELSEYIESRRRIATRRRVRAAQEALDREEEEYWDRSERELREEYNQEQSRLCREHLEAINAR